MLNGFWGKKQLISTFCLTVLHDHRYFKVRLFCFKHDPDRISCIVAAFLNEPFCSGDSNNKMSMLKNPIIISEFICLRSIVFLDLILLFQTFKLETSFSNLVFNVTLLRIMLSTTRYGQIRCPGKCTFSYFSTKIWCGYLKV